jgi:hypothetical protein
VIGYCASDCLAQYEDELGQKLGRINALRNHGPATLGQIETESVALLKDYTKPEEQGRIFYQIAMSYAQAGVWKKGHAAKVIDYAQKGLRQPIDPRLRLELYLYWGNAIAGSDRSRPISLRRAEASPIYLNGLKEAKQFNIPDAPPKQPPSFLSRMGPGMGMGEEAFKREREKHAMECQRVLRLEILCTLRDAMHRELVCSYSRIPRAPDELRKLATETLGAGPEVEKLMDALAAKCEAMDKRLEP